MSESFQVRDGVKLVVSDADSLPTYRRSRARRSLPANITQSSRAVADPRVMKEAIRLARGNRARLVVNPDGSVSVANSVEHRTLILARRRDRSPS